MAISISTQSPEVLFPGLLADATAISNACNQLLDFMNLQPESLRFKYRLELLPGAVGKSLVNLGKERRNNLFPFSSGWGAKIKLDSVSWFDVLTGSVGLPVAAASARRFITDTRNQIRTRPPLTPPNNVVVVDTPKYCMNPECAHGGLELPLSLVGLCC